LLGSWLPPVGEETNTCAISGSLALAGTYLDFFVLDVSDPTQPQVRAQVTLPNGAETRDLAIVGTVALVGTSFGKSTVGRILTYDLTDPTAPVLLDSLDVSGSRAIHAEGARLYVAGFNGLSIVDISNPAALQILGAFAGSASGPWSGVSWAGSDVLASGNTVFFGDLQLGLVVFDVSDPTSPLPLTTPNQTSSRADGLDVAGSILYVTTGFHDQLQIYDVSIPQSPRLIGSQTTLGTAYDVISDGSRAYVGEFNAELTILDVSGCVADPFPSSCSGEAIGFIPSPCPCSNGGNRDSGCNLPQATGGVKLDVLAQVTGPMNRATLQGTGFPANSAPTAIVIRASDLGASPVAFGDGLRCVGTPVVRLAVTFASGGASNHIVGHGSMAGTGRFYYQLWFSSTPATFCTPDAFNLSNGRTVIW